MPRPLRQRLLTSVSFAALAGTSLFAQGCLDRPIAKSDPRTSNTVVEKVKLAAVDKIDLLFVIDNSASMADKQAILALAVPDLVTYLVTPRCVVTDPNGKVSPAADQSKNADGSCKQVGAAPEFEAVKDIHIGIVTSSLGGHGANTCEPGQTNYNPSNNDHAHLVARKPGTAKDANPAKVPSYQGKDFFFWDPANKAGGEANAATLTQNFRDAVVGVDQVGCGYEATLESWYRFLIEPNPPATVNFANPGGASGQPGVNMADVSGATDLTLLQQRADFLRPDSLVAIISLSDENDCSMIDGRLPNAFCDEPPPADDNGVIPGGLDDNGNPTDCKSGLVSSWDNGTWNDEQRARLAPYGVKRAIAAGTTFRSNYLPAVSSGGFRMRPGTSACEQNPNSPDCKSCYEGSAGGDPTCQASPSGLDIKQDGVSMRCFEQKRRFGLDMLYPTEKYVRALFEDTVYDRNGYRVANPLFQDLPYEKKTVTRAKLPGRSKSFVFFAGIVGVPWQDLARQADPKDPKSVDLSLGYKPGAEVDWDLVVGNPRGEDFAKPGSAYSNPPIAPKDPLMVESTEVRSGTQPITGETIGANGWNSVNGNDHYPEKEASSTAAKDLMFACIFPLLKPQDCSKEACADCFADTAKLAGTNNPLCAPSKSDGTGDFGKISGTQSRAKAYPGTRFLEVMRYYAQLNPGGVIPASICARNVTDDQKPDYGYRPAVSSIVDALKVQLAGKCLPRQLDPAEDGTTPCLIVDAQYRKPAAGSAPNNPDEVKTCQACVGANNSRKKLDPKTESLIRSAGGEVAEYDCLCEVTQLTNPADVKECRTVPGTLGSLSSGNGGWCYVDPTAKGLSDADVAAAEQIVSKCPATQKHTIRFVAADTTNKDLFITCLGAASGTTEIKKLRASDDGRKGRSRCGASLFRPSMPPSTKKTILLVEDEPHIAMGLRDALEFEGFCVLHAAKGRDAVNLARAEGPDCVLLDLMLPDINGYQVCEELRRWNAFVPILMLTARSQESDKIRGLDAGADDYVTKPFSVGELVARIRALFRRAGRPTDVAHDEFTIGAVSVDLSAHVVSSGKTRHELSFYEAELLRFLRERMGQPVSRDEILSKIWGLESTATNRSVDNAIVKLRKKIERAPDKPEHILTVYGFGYKLV